MSFKKHFEDGLHYVAHVSECLVKTAEDWIGCKISLSNVDKIREAADVEYGESLESAVQYALDMLEREGKQASEALYHNLNTLESRAGSQVERCLA